MAEGKPKKINEPGSDAGLSPDVKDKINVAIVKQSDEDGQAPDLTDWQEPER